MKTFFRSFSRSARQSNFRRRHFVAALGTAFLASTMLIQLIIPAIKVEAADATIGIVPSNPAIQCAANLKVDANYLSSAGQLFRQAPPPSGSGYYGFNSTVDKVVNQDPMPYIEFSSGNSSSDAECKQAAYLFQSPIGQENRTFYGYQFDSPVKTLVATIDLSNVNAPTLLITLNGQAHTIVVNDPSHFAAQTAYFPQAGGGGGGGTNTGPCGIFTLPGTISACQQNPNPRFTDIATINYRGEVYTTTHWGGSSTKYYLSGSFEPNRKTYNIDKGVSCRPYISISADKSNGEGLDINLDDDTLGSLQDIEKTLAGAEAHGSVDAKYTEINYSCATLNSIDVHVGDPTNARIWGAYYDATKTVNLFFTDADHNENLYLSAYKTTDYKTFAGTNIAGCEQDAPHFDFGQTLNTVGAGTATVSGNWFLNSSNPCEQYAQIGVRVRIAPKDQQPPAIKSNTANEPDAAVHVDCEWSFNPLTWIMCPLLDATQGIINTVGSFIKDQLQIDANTYFDKDNSDTGKKIYQAWNSVRIIALTLLVVIALVMVIAQALSLEVFDAYTVKKVLPKLAIAIIGITLSWEITRLLVVFSNDLAKAVQSIILAPFGSLGNPTLNASQVGVAAGGLAVVGIAFLLTIFAAAALALLLAFIAIVLRQMIVIFLVIVAPIAILASILPNTQKAWKIWHETFNGALLVYSIIVGFIALGAAFGKVVDETKTPAAPFIALIATYAPYFLIPKAFSMASGLVGTLGGMVNDRSKGLFDGLRKRRGAIMKNRYERAKNESLYNPNHPALQKMNQYKWGRRLNPNKLATWAASPHKNLAYAAREGHIPFLSATGRRLQGSINSAKMEQSEKALQHVNKHGANDKFYRAIGGMYRGFNKDTQAALIAEGFATGDVERDAAGNVTAVRNIAAKKSLRSERDFTRMADIMGRSSSDSEQKAALALRGNASYLGGLYTDPEMNYADTATVGALGLASHQFFDSNDAADAGNLMARESGGDVDYAHAAVVQAEVIGARGHPEAKAGYGHVIDEHGNFVAGTDLVHNRSWAVAGTLGAGDYSGMKGDGLNGAQAGEGLGGDLIDMLKVSDPKGADVQVVQRMRAAGVSEEEITKRVGMAEKDRASIANTLLAVASGASYASADVKTQATRILNEAGMSDDLQNLMSDPDAMRIAHEQAQQQITQQQQQGGGPPP